MEGVKATLMLEREFSDVKDRLEDLSGEEACLEADMEIRSVKGARALASLDPEAAEAVAKMLMSIYEKVKSKVSEVARAIEEIGEASDLESQLAVLSKTYKAYELIEDYFPVSVGFCVFKVGRSSVKVVGLEFIDEAPPLTFVSIEGPEEEVESIKTELMREEE